MTASTNINPIVIAGGLIAAAIAFSALHERSIPTHYQITAGAGGVLRMDTTTGEIEGCHPLMYPDSVGGGYSWTCDLVVGMKPLPAEGGPAR